MIGVLLYTEGHGIHLAANSIYNVAPGEPARLWDEAVGHLLWYGGFWIVVVAVVLAVKQTAIPVTPIGMLLSLAVGVTHATNADGAHAPVPAVAALAATGFVILGWRLRSAVGRYLSLSYAVAGLMLAILSIA